MGVCASVPEDSRNTLGGEFESEERRERREVAREEGVPLVDVHRAFEAYGRAPGQSIRELLIAGDGIHPSAAGQRLVCRLLTAALAGVVRP